MNNPSTNRQIAKLATRIPRLTRIELLNPADDGSWPVYSPTEIVPGLYQGGTAPDAEPQHTGSHRFDTIVTLYPSIRPVPSGVEERHFELHDAPLESADIDTALSAARLAHQRWSDGAEVLIRCQAGLNRSGLVTALVLILAGLEPGQAIALIRQQRGQSCLYNQDFVEWLLDHSVNALAESGNAQTDPPSPAAPPRAHNESPASVPPPCHNEGVGAWDKHRESLAGRLAEAVEQVGPGMFLILDFEDESADAGNPYAQMAHTGGDPLCEIISARNLPPDEWSLNELALQRSGWSAPYGSDFPNWWRFDLAEPLEIATGLLVGLRDGRGCTDPHGFSWHIGHFPGGPGDRDEIPEGADVIEWHTLAA